MPQLSTQHPPPADYYADNLSLLLDEVRQRSGELLDARERNFIDAVRGLGAAARRLFARLHSRKGPWIRIDRLNYREIDDLPAALAELRDAGLAAVNAPAPADALLRLLVRDERQRLFPALRSRLPRGATREHWIGACIARYPDALIRARISARHPWVSLLERRAFRTCQILFFGDDHADLSSFVIQDLGIVRYEPYPLGPETRPFADREQLLRYLRCRQLGALLQRPEPLPGVHEVIRRALWSAPRSRTEQRLRDRLLNQLGREHERAGEFDTALECHALCRSHPGRERCARLLRRLGDETAVTELLARMQRDPWCAEEADFARRFALPRKRPASAWPVEVRGLDAMPATRIETHAVAELTAAGGRGWHLENLFPLGLAGLAFWEQVFAPVQGAFSHPFQLGPRDLFWEDFAVTRRAALDARCAELAPPGGFFAALESTFERKQGIANRLVQWEVWDRELLDRLRRNVPEAVLLRLATLVIRQLHWLRRGFPDLLLIYGPGAFELVEVKGPGDQLQPAQRIWLDTLARLSVPVRVLKFRPHVEARTRAKGGDGC